MNLRKPLLSLALALGATLAHAQTIANFPVTTLSIGIHVIKAEVATSDAEREQGLMFRKSMGVNEGMVFVFDRPATVCMWMKNTLIPLSVAFIDANGKIMNIEEMKAQTLESHCGKDKGVLYALEMNQAWFKHKNIKAGMTVDGLPAVRR